MKIEIVGFRKLDFTTKENQQIKGTQLYAIYPSTNQHVTGSEVLLKEDNYKNKKLPFVPESVCADITLGFYDVTFDINGAIASILKVNK